MVLDPDMFCSLALTGAAGALAIAVVASRSQDDSSRADTRAGLPKRMSETGLRCLDRLAQMLTTAGISANAITMLSLCLAAVASVLLGFGHFGLGAVAMVVASSGDALDGLVARKSGTASAGGALLDASVDRYEEFFFLAAIAVYLRGSVWLLVLTLFALAGSFMVSYGSAKAEAMGRAVPPGAMRRTERAVSLCTGAALTTPFASLADRLALPQWLAHLPLLFALALVAVGANISAIHRLRSLTRGQSVTRRRPLVEEADTSTAANTVTPYARS
jgi:phosphatidylglycerophosphate synthase